MNTYCRLLLFGLLLLTSLSVWGQAGYYPYPPVYYVETYAGIEQIEELPHDTLKIYDTVYVSDADEFLKKYYNGKIDLNRLVADYNLMKQTIDSLNKVTGEHLYYNFFLRNQKAGKLSNSVIVREFKIDKNLKASMQSVQDLLDDKDPDFSREILFTCEGANRTDRFLNDPDAVLKAISYLFTQMQNDPVGVKAINLYFPDFTFREKRAMVQFVKSVRVVMDASKNFKYGKTRLNVIFLDQKNKESQIGEDFKYAIMLKASELIFINAADVLENFYVEGDHMTRDEVTDINFITRMKSHFYVARYTPHAEDFTHDDITDFSAAKIKDLITADYPENNWEPYLWALIGLIILGIIVIAVYFLYLPFAYLLNRNMGIVLLSSIIYLFELFTLVGMVFQHMCTEDTETSISDNPWLMFCLPILMVIILPLLRELSRGKKLP